jgi:hypothetical protein
MAKKALVWTQEYIDKQVGHLERVDEAEAIDSWSNNLRDMMATVDVPVELEDKSWHELEAVQVDGEWVIQEKI